jgi:hypothetical protein
MPGTPMTAFFKTSTTWVVDFQYDGRPRRGFRAFGPGIDVGERMAAELRQLHGTRARLVAVRPATDEEEAAYLRGDEPKNLLCPTGHRGPPSGKF